MQKKKRVQLSTSPQAHCNPFINRCLRLRRVSSTLRNSHPTLRIKKIYHFQIIIMPLSYRNCGTFASKNAFFDMKLIEFWDKMHIHTYRVR